MVKYFRQFTQIFCMKQIVLVLRWICERRIFIFKANLITVGYFHAFSNEFIRFFYGSILHMILSRW